MNVFIYLLNKHRIISATVRKFRSDVMIMTDSSSDSANEKSIHSSLGCFSC